MRMGIQILERLAAATAVALGCPTALSPDLMSSLNIQMETPRNCVPQYASFHEKSQVLHGQHPLFPCYAPPAGSRNIHTQGCPKCGCHVDSDGSFIVHAALQPFIRDHALWRGLTSWEASMTEPVAKIQQRIQYAMPLAALDTR